MGGRTVLKGGETRGPGGGGGRAGGPRAISSAQELIMASSMHESTYSEIRECGSLGSPRLIEPIQILSNAFNSQDGLEIILYKCGCFKRSIKRMKKLML